MQIFLRIVAFLLYWIGCRLQSIIKLCKNIRREKVPRSKNDILSISATCLIGKLKSGEITSENLVRQYIARIKEVNPLLNAVIEDRFIAAIEDAKKVDATIASSKEKEELFQKYPLLGVPFTVKESCALEGLSHVVGSHYRRGIKTDKDGVAISLIRKAGAIPLLASATPELCVSWETSTFTHGRCCNPYNTERTPGGSSGGEGALNGAGASVFGIGSDLCGSVRIPALFNGVFGHKPTGGLISNEGHFPNVDDVNFDQLLQPGPITRFAEDLPLLLDLLAGKNVTMLLKGADIDEIKVFYMDLGLRLTTVPVCDSIKKSIKSACDHFTSRGNKVQKLEIKEMYDTLEVVATTLLLYKPPIVYANPANSAHKTSIILELSKHFTGKAIHTVQALYFQALNDISVFFPVFRESKYLKKKEDLISNLKAALGTDGVLFFPTFHRSAFLHNTSIIHSPGTILTGLFNMIGFPALHVPMGLDEDGLPIGFQVVAAPYADRNCFRVALELQKAYGGWVPPP